MAAGRWRSLRTDPRNAAANAVDARQGGYVERAAVLVAPGEVVWVLEHVGEPERRVGEIQRAVGAVHEVVRRVQALALVRIGEHRDIAVGLYPKDPAVAVLAHRQPAPHRVEREPVRSGLVVAADV